MTGNRLIGKKIGHQARVYNFHERRQHMLKRLALMTVAAGALLAFAAAPASAQKQTIKFAQWTGPAHHMAKTLVDWSDLVRKESKGNLIVEIDKAPLAKPPGQYDLVKNGIRDMAWPVASYTRGRFDLMLVGELPWLCPNATICSQALTRWYKKHGFDKMEFNDGKTTWLFSNNHGPGTIHTTVDVQTLDDIKGIKMRAGGSGVPIAKSLGMSVVAMSATEVHEALQRKTVDGVLFPWEAMNSFRLSDMVCCHLEIPGGLYTGTFFYPINNKTYDGLSASNRAALLRASGVVGAKLLGEHWDAADKVARDDAIKLGQKIHTLSDKEKTRWEPLLDFVRKDWVDMANKKGLDGNALVEDFKAMVKLVQSGS